MYMAPGRLLSPVASGSGLIPSLDHDFTSLTALPNIYTFSRGSHATMWSSGALVYAPHNLALWSQDATQASWGKNNCTATGGVTTAPDGTTTGDLITCTSTTCSVVQTVTIPSGARVAVSVYAKAGTVSWMRLRIQGGAETAATWFNLASGALGAAPVPTANILISGQTITDAGGGWRRVSAVFSTTGFTALSVGSGPAAADVGTGTTGNTISIWGAQAEIHGSARTYLPTTSAAVYGPRFDSDPLPTTTNMLFPSEDFSAGGGGWTHGSLTYTANAETSPTGTLTADLVTVTGAGDIIYKVMSVTASTQYTFSYFVKLGTKPTNRYAIYNETGAAFIIAATDAVGPVQGSWTRVSVTFTTPVGCTQVRVYPERGNTSNIGTSYLWGAQLVAGASAGAYAATTSAIATTYLPRGLLIEEAKNNYAPSLLSNATYWSVVGAVVPTVSATAAPTGRLEATTVTEPAGGVISYGLNLATGSIPTITAGVAMCASIYARAGTCNWLRLILCDATAFTVGASGWFNLSTGAKGTLTTLAGSPTNLLSTIEACPNGYYRCSVSCIMPAVTTATMLIRLTSADNTSSDAGSNTMDFYGPQLEVLGFPSSYIPTTTATVTRSIDLASAPLSALPFNPAAGTLFAEATSMLFNASSSALAVHDGTGSNLISLRFRTGTPFLAASLTTASAAQIATSGSSTYTAGATAKLSIGYQTDDVATYFNGANGITDSGATIPTVTTLQLGGRNSSQEPLNGYLRKIRLFRSRLPNATLQSLTT